ncbi:hypothetical protein MUP01_04590 [Candidatus Bathyarchaeota archaeon]|nr:hypothetical protein [Candidatus Bathyarchaeota archaeon]
MSSARTILRENYSNGRAMTNIRIAVLNRDGSRQTTIQKRVQIDTGFDSGVQIRESEISELSIIGVKPTHGSVTLAGNIPASAYYCLGYLQRIGEWELPPPGMEIVLVFQGSNREGLLGLEVLSHWIATFDGPNQSFKIVCPTA